MNINLPVIYGMTTIFQLVIDLEAYNRYIFQLVLYPSLNDVHPVNNTKIDDLHCITIGEVSN